MIAWQSITTVFLDMDGTLLDLNFDNHFWLEFVPLRYAQQHGISVEEARAQLMPRFRATEGRLEWYCLDYWSEQLNLDIAGMKVEIAGLIAILPHVTEFLEFLRRRSKRVVLVTNAHPKSLGLKMDRTCLSAFFDSIVSSHSLGCPKEDPRFWKRLRTIEHFRSQQTLLVDDSLPVLRSALAFGIAHLIAIRKNDSRQPARDINEFPAIHDFRELMACGPTQP